MKRILVVILLALFTSVPARASLAALATFCSDASNLQIQRDDYAHSEIWREGMAKAVNETAASMKTDTSPEQLEALHWGIARRRAKIEDAMGKTNGRFLDATDDAPEMKYQTDFIPLKSSYDPLFRAKFPPGQPLSDPRRFEGLPLSCYFTMWGQVHIGHAGKKTMKKLRARGYELVSEVLTDKKLTEAEALDKLARAHFLLIEAPLTVRGAGSTSHALIDSALRARFGHGLPKLKKGVVLDYEIFLSKDIDEYAKNFSTFFEP